MLGVGGRRALNLLGAGRVYPHGEEGMKGNSVLITEIDQARGETLSRPYA